MATLRAEPGCWWFWGRAGFKSNDLSRMFPEGHGVLRSAKFPELEIVAAGAHKHLRKLTAKARLVAIPVLAAHAGTHGARGDQVLDLDSVPVSEMLAAPDLWCPNPAETNCLRVRGLSMSPMINEGDIVAVDCSQTDPKSLSGKNYRQLAAGAWTGAIEVSAGETARSCSSLKTGNTNPVALGKNRNWRIIGRVLWWIRTAP